MKNFEKYIDVIIEDFNLGTSLLCALAHIRGDKNSCSGIRCRECVADSLDWLKEEYKEPVKLSHDEYVILKNISNESKYIVRDRLGELETWGNIPTRAIGIWTTDGESTFRSLSAFDHLFQFINFDTEPLEIAKLIADYEKEHGDGN